MTRDPRAVLSAVWGSALKRAGIAWNPSPFIGAPPTGGPQILAEVSSPPLDSLASEINRRSLNLGAELLLQWAGGRDRAPALLTDHVRQVVGSSDGVYLVDGSGLSYEDRVTPHAFVTYLAKFPMTPAGRNFPMLLPANGSGTLHRLNSGFPGVGVVRAKTGTLGRVSTVVGYLGRPGGHPAGGADVQRRPALGGPAGAVEAVPRARRQRRRHPDRYAARAAGPARRRGDRNARVVDRRAGAAESDSLASDASDRLPEAEPVVEPAPVAARADSVARADVDQPESP